MKVKEESAKAGLHLNIRKTKVRTMEETHNFNIDNENMETGKIVLTLMHSSTETDCSQEIKRRLRLGTEVEELRITKSKHVSVEI